MVEEIQGCPYDGRQHIYVWRQRGDHWAGHEEIAEVEEAERVERAAKRLVNKVKVSDLPTLKIVNLIETLSHVCMCSQSAGHNENSEIS